LQCQYCYFGTQEMPAPTHVGALSHQGHRDVALDTLLAFLRTCTSTLVRRVFLAGGEPLVWLGARRVIAALKALGCEVIVCTNGLPLQHDDLCRFLLAQEVDAVSISLDSVDSEVNDHVRQDRSGQGWQGVVAGIRNLIRLRHAAQAPMKIGVYSVVTQQTLPKLAQTGCFVADLGAEYFIMQPVSLAAGHPLHDALCVDGRHAESFGSQLRQLQEACSGLFLGHPDYLAKMQITLHPGPFPLIRNCFGGRELFFIEPDGSVWDCPSAAKIAQTPVDQRHSIIHTRAGELFSAARRCRPADCALFSQDCVNMWQLMAFDAILAPERNGHEHLL
jgi:sulfatase maturation enzyme AslB (radical SAM superfamily)